MLLKKVFILFYLGILLITILVVIYYFGLNKDFKFINNKYSKLKNQKLQA